jgi:hypothetical protein
LCVSLAWSLGTAAAIATVLTVLANRERRTVRAARGTILYAVQNEFSNAQLTTDDAGFPRLEGVINDRHLRLDLIPDTMTIRRLPQLWLAVTDLQPLPIVNRGIAILVRPSGADYYSLTERMSYRLDVPAGFPWESLVKGETAHSAGTLARIRPIASVILADPKIKEIAITQRGVRIVQQLAEGKRGDHLLLRQCAFEGARLDPLELRNLVTQLEHLSQALRDASKGQAA